MFFKLEELLIIRTIRLLRLASSLKRPSYYSENMEFLKLCRSKAPFQICAKPDFR